MNAMKERSRQKTFDVQLDDRQLEFAVFCVESVAEELKLSGDEVYRMLVDQSDILDEYIIQNYEILHTQGKAYIVQDIVGYLREKGVLK